MGLGAPELLFATGWGDAAGGVGAGRGTVGPASGVGKGIAFAAAGMESGFGPESFGSSRGSILTSSK